jgi:hypothetical protein
MEMEQRVSSLEEIITSLEERAKSLQERAKSLDHRLGIHAAKTREILERLKAGDYATSDIALAGMSRSIDLLKCTRGPRRRELRVSPTQARLVNSFILDRP